MRAVLSIAALLVVLAVVAIGARRALAPDPQPSPAAAAPSTDSGVQRETIDRVRRELDAAAQAAAERASAAD